MRICLKTSAKQGEETRVHVRLSDRLPVWIQSPCDLNCTYQVTPVDGYYLLDLIVDGELPITCQRCLIQKPYTYHYQTQFAVCSNEKQADRLMETFECVMSEGGELDLVEMLTDELYLNSPEMPHEWAECPLDLSLFK